MTLRRNINRLDDAEQAKLIQGFKALKSSGRYDEITRLHAAHVANVHGGPAFLPWYRALLIEVERGMQTVLGDPSFGLPYWDWAEAAALPEPARARLWGPTLMGPGGAPVATGPFASGSWTTLDATGAPAGALVRSLGQSRPEGASAPAKLPTKQAVLAALALPNYDSSPWDASSEESFRRAIEDLSGAARRWVGGQMAELALAPNDPVFWLHQCNVDRIWTERLQTRPAPRYLPNAGARKGHNLTDPMPPWDGTGNGGTQTPESVLALASSDYEGFYEIAKLVVVVRTSNALFSGTDDPISLTLFGPSAGVTFELDGAHCDHADPFESGQTDTFTFTEILDRATQAKVTADALSYLTIRKSSATRTGDWRIAAITVKADHLVLYDNQSLNVKLVQSESRFTDNLQNPRL